MRYVVENAVISGDTVLAGTIRREGIKIHRNDLCPCGSGKKYKKCCSDKVPEVILRRSEK